MREATVHFSIVAWPSGEDTTHLCETCYPKAEAERTASYGHPKAEAERTTSYGPKRKSLRVIDVRRITALEYLDLGANARANSVAAATFQHISEELERLPATRERLATEMLTMALQSLEKGDDAWNLVAVGGCFVFSEATVKSQAFMEVLERIVLRSVELMAQSPNPPAPHPFGLGLTMAANALRRADPGRFSKLLKDLKARHRKSPSALAVVDYLEGEMARKGWSGKL